MYLTLNILKLSISFRFLHKDTLIFHYLYLGFSTRMYDFTVVKFFKAGYNKKAYAFKLFNKILYNSLKR